MVIEYVVTGESGCVVVNSIELLFVFFLIGTEILLEISDGEEEAAFICSKLGSMGEARKIVNFCTFPAVRRMFDGGEKLFIKLVVTSPLKDGFFSGVVGVFLREERNRNKKVKNTRAAKTPTANNPFFISELLFICL